MDLDAGVMVALADQSAFGLLEPVRPVGDGEFVCRVEPGLDVDPDTHLHGRPEQHAHPPAAHRIPQRLACTDVGVVVHPGDLIPSNTTGYERVGEHRIDRRARAVGDTAVAEHDLCRPRDGGAGEHGAGGVVVDAGDGVGRLDQLGHWCVPIEVEVLVTCCRPLGAGFGADRGRVQRRRAGGAQDRDHRVFHPVGQVEVFAGGSFTSPVGHGALIMRWWGQVNVRAAAVEDGKRETETVGTAHIAKRAEHARQVREVPILRQADHRFQVAFLVVLDPFHG